MKAAELQKEQSAPESPEEQLTSGRGQINELFLAADISRTTDGVQPAKVQQLS